MPAARRHLFQPETVNGAMPERPNLSVSLETNVSEDECPIVQETSVPGNVR